MSLLITFSPPQDTAEGLRTHCPLGFEMPFPRTLLQKGAQTPPEMTVLGFCPHDMVSVWK